MSPEEARTFIKDAVIPGSGVWADIGAGTGVFTVALMSILKEGRVIAVDKSPHALYQLRATGNIELQIEEGDFTRPLSLPDLDGVLMANAVHYAQDHVNALKNCISSLKPDGTFLLIEYDTSTPKHPWVPYPVSWKRFESICGECGLSAPQEMGRRKSIYGDGDLYLAMAQKLG